MSHISNSRRSRRRTVGLAVASLSVGLAGALSLPTAQAGADPAKPGTAQQHQKMTGASPRVTTYDAGRYVVVLKAPAAASYTGGTKGYAPTKAAGSAPFKADSKAVQTYAKHLRSVQDKVASSVGASASKHYTLALNGFTADLSGAAATKLATDKNVLLLQKDAKSKVDTWQTPSFLGLDGANGAWAQHGGEANAGDGIVVGVIDSGIWPSTGSFKGAPLTSTPSTKWDISMSDSGATRMEKSDGTVFRGQCETGDRFTLSMCSTKIIGARYYPDGYLADTPPAERPDSEFISPRDGSGHGSHTSSTAAGNPVNNVRVEGRSFGTITGMAPAAKIAVYKVCYENVDPDLSGCANSDILLAIDDAIADGVDVINYSISGALDTVIDPIELAYEGAAEAGIFVAASAGNSGPDASTVAHNSPWLTTVAAGTHVNFDNTIILSDRTKIVGSSINGTPVPRTPLVYSADAVVSGGDVDDADICGPDTLDPAVAGGKIVICYRGVYDRVAKSAEVERAGGIAMILVNPSPNSLNADFHAVPTVHISDTDGSVLADYMETNPNPTALIAVGNRTDTVNPLPQVAGFSSRGPALANDGDLLKPDITAPGQDVLAAVAPPSNSGRRFDIYSGTSMSSPHIAGLAAFMQGVHPTWTPMMIKSAMMTTASKVLRSTGKTDTDVFATGSGQVQPKKFLDPGIFVTESARNWRGFITGQGLDTGVPAVDPKDLNIPSFADSSVPGAITISRTLLATQKGTWKVKSYLPGFTVTTSPSTVVSKRVNDLVDVDFTFTRTTATLGSYAKGAITLVGPTHVRMPVAMRPVSLAVPAEATGEGSTGSVTIPVTAGDTGTVDLETTGLAKSDVSADSVAVNDYNLYCMSVTPGTTKVVQFLADAVDNSADLDMYVYRVDNPCTFDGIAEVGSSATGSADEEVLISDPVDANYVIEVDGYAAGTDGTDPVPFDFVTTDVGGAPDEGAFTATPDPLPVTQGVPTSFDVSWSGLTGASRYLGVVRYAGATDQTLVRVTSDPTP
ncbi:hypothetical protein BH11ACT8_BH11ACT8_09660 [soil metagenome]